MKFYRFIKFIAIVSLSSSQDLYYAKIYSNNFNGYIKNDPINVSVGIANNIDQAKKFWMTQDPVNEKKLKLRCDKGGVDVLTVQNENEIIYMAEAKELNKEQFFYITKMPEYTEAGKWIYSFSNNHKFLSYNKTNLIVVKKNHKYEDLKFEFIPVDNLTTKPPARFAPKEEYNITDLLNYFDPLNPNANEADSSLNERIGNSISEIPISVLDSVKTEGSAVLDQLKNLDKYEFIKKLREIELDNLNSIAKTCCCGL